MNCKGRSCDQECRSTGGPTHLTLTLSIRLIAFPRLPARTRQHRRAFRSSTLRPVASLRASTEILIALHPHPVRSPEPAPPPIPISPPAWTARGLEARAPDPSFVRNQVDLARPCAWCPGARRRVGISSAAPVSPTSPPVNADELHVYAYPKAVFNEPFFPPGVRLVFDSPKPDLVVVRHGPPASGPHPLADRRGALALRLAAPRLRQLRGGGPGRRQPPQR